jgi:hypothetical protein
VPHGVGGRHAGGPVGDCRRLGRIDCQIASRWIGIFVLLFRQKGINESIFGWETTGISRCCGTKRSVQRDECGGWCLWSDDWIDRLVEGITGVRSEKPMRRNSGGGILALTLVYGQEDPQDA